MDLDDIKRGLRAEIKKRENEQYATFQCNVRQMCKDTLEKLEEQEKEIAELKSKARRLSRALYKACANWALSTLAWLDCIDQGNPRKWSEMVNKCRAMVKKFKEE